MGLHAIVGFLMSERTGEMLQRQRTSRRWQAAAVEAGGMPKRRARGSVLREGDQGARMHRRVGGEDRSGQACRYAVRPGHRGAAAAATSGRRLIGGSVCAIGVASSNWRLGQCDEERRLEALGRRLASRRTAGIALAMRVWPG
jgi:hypothetical protein